MAVAYALVAGNEIQVLQSLIRLFWAMNHIAHTGIGKAHTSSHHVHFLHLSPDAPLQAACPEMLPRVHGQREMQVIDMQKCQRFSPAAVRAL